MHLARRSAGGTWHGGRGHGQRAPPRIPSCSHTRVCNRVLPRSEPERARPHPRASVPHPCRPPGPRSGQSALGPRAKRGLAGRRPAAKRLARYGEGGATVAAAAGATSERPPRSSRERAVLPSKEMRSLPCAAHLGSPRCYFYLTFQGPFPFSGCFCCDSTVASTSLFPSLPFASSFTLSFLSMHSFLPLHWVPSPPPPYSRRARSKLAASVPTPVNPHKRRHKPPTATQMPNWQHWAQPPLFPVSKGSQGEMPGGVRRQHPVIFRLGSSCPPLVLLCFIREGADGLVEGGGLCSSLDAEKGSESLCPKPDPAHASARATGSHPWSIKHQ